MKFRVDLFLRLVWPSAATLCCMTTLAAQPPKPAAPSAKPEVTEPEVHSVFAIPHNPKEGRDPFFPNSTHGFSGLVTPTTASVPAAPPKMTLMGISGPREKHLAIINGRTFGKGEEQDVPSANGRVHIRCLEIKEESVIIEVNGERQELRLRQGL